MYIPHILTASRVPYFRSGFPASADLNRFVERYLFNETPTPFPFGKFPTIKNLAEAAPKELSSRSICNTARLSTGAVIPPVEAVYQNPFYKALKGALGFAARVSSEWSPTGKGRIDFRLLDVPWGFELLRESDRLSGHCERFVDGGSYSRWVKKGWLEDWLIINFCTSYPSEPYGMTSSHIHLPNTNIACQMCQIRSCGMPSFRMVSRLSRS